MRNGITFFLSFFLLVHSIQARAQEESPNRVVTEKLIARIDVSSWIQETFKVSPDGRRIAYSVKVSKWFGLLGTTWSVVVDGKEGKQYDRIGTGTPIFSPDSKRVAYGAQVGDKWFVVVDGREGQQYDAIVTVGGGRILFGSPDSLHYLAQEGAKIYLVEEKLR